MHQKRLYGRSEIGDMLQQLVGISTLSIGLEVRLLTDLENSDLVELFPVDCAHLTVGIGSCRTSDSPVSSRLLSSVHEAQHKYHLLAHGSRRSDCRKEVFVVGLEHK